MMVDPVGRRNLQAPKAMRFETQRFRDPRVIGEGAGRPRADGTYADSPTDSETTHSNPAG
jgi:hypothetical protein